MRLEQIYQILPIWAQNMAASIEGYRICRSRYSSSFTELLKAAQARTYWSVDQMTAYRDRRISDFIKHCYMTVPYYRRKFREWGVDPASVNTLEDLVQKIPVLTKAEVQRNIADFISEAVPKCRLMMVHTSGTTGGGLRFPSTQEALQEQWAVWWRYRNWHQITFETWCGYFGGRSVVPLKQTYQPYWRLNYPGRQILFSGYHINEKSVPFYVEALNKHEPLWLHGYPSLLSLVAAFIIDSGKRLSYDVKWITTGAENLLEHQRDLIIRAFDVQPAQHYGQAEAVANFSQCENGNLHVDEDFSAVEFIADAEGRFKIAGTNFTNYATPLLRYDTQDIAEVSGDSCACGRPGRVVAKVDGRQEDYIVLKNGSLIGRLDHIFKDLVMIREAQIYQEEPGKIELRIVRRDGYTEQDEQQLVEEVRRRLGDIEIDITYLQEIVRTRAGKLRFVVSSVRNPINH